MADHPQRDTYLVDVLRAARTQGQVRLELGPGRAVQRTFEVVGDEFDDLLASDREAGFGTICHGDHHALDHRTGARRAASAIVHAALTAGELHWRSDSSACSAIGVDDIW